MAECGLEGATANRSAVDEGVPEAATSKQSVKTEGDPEGATANQSVTAEGDPKGATAKHSVMTEGDPKGATAKQSVTAEEKQAGSVEDDEDWIWTKYLIEKPSKEIIKLMKEDPELMSKRITVVCSQACTCSKAFETMAFDEVSYTKDIYQNLKTLIKRGRCPHMFAEANTSPGLRVAKPLRTQDIPVSCLQDTNTSVTQTVTKQCAPNVLAGITAIHVASTFGKVKVVEYIVNAIVERKPLRFTIYSEEIMTSVHKIEPYQLAVLHRQDQILGVMTSHITTAMAYTDAYQNVFHTSMKLAVQDDNARSLKILVSGGRGITEYLIHYCAFLIAIKNRRIKCIKCLVKKGVKLWPPTLSKIIHRCPCLLTRDDVIKDMLLQDENTMVEELLQLKGVGCRFMLYYAVFYDNTSVTTLILENYKRRLSKEKPYRDIPVVVQAVLNNSTRILEILLQSGYAHTRYKHYTALTWARALHFDRCALLLENAGDLYDMDATQNYPPLVMLFGKYITSFYYSKSALISRLLEHGNNVNRESVNGKTALYTALESRTYSLVRQLLMAGADPFFGRNCLTTFLSLRLLGELLYANVDIFRSRPEVSLLHQVLFSIPDLQSHLLFLLQHAHTIPKSNLKLLTALHDSNTVSPDTLHQINSFLSTTKSLVHRSRDVVRGYFGYKIHDYVRTSNLPSQIKSLLTLEGSLDCFLSLSFDEKKFT